MQCCGIFPASCLLRRRGDMLVERTSFLLFPVNENVQCLDQVFIQIIFSNFRIGPGDGRLRQG